MKALRETARKVGHGSGTLRKHYLIPELESSFISRAEIIDISDREKYEDGGVIEKRKTENSITERVQEFMNDGGEINSRDLKEILGYSPKYPSQVSLLYNKIMPLKLCHLYTETIHTGPRVSKEFYHCYRSKFGHFCFGGVFIL